MPQASQELQEIIQHRFHSLDECGPVDFLKSRGYIFNGRGVFTTPSLQHVIKDDEIPCIDFLVYEWDYAYLKRATHG